MARKNYRSRDVRKRLAAERQEREEELRELERELHEQWREQQETVVDEDDADFGESQSA